MVDSLAGSQNNRKKLMSYMGRFKDKYSTTKSYLAWRLNYKCGIKPYALL